VYSDLYRGFNPENRPNILGENVYSDLYLGFNPQTRPNISAFLLQLNCTPFRNATVRVNLISLIVIIIIGMFIIINASPRPTIELIFFLGTVDCAVPT